MNDQSVTPSKKPYTMPELREWGKIIDITNTGLTNPGADAKAGSVLSRGK